MCAGTLTGRYRAMPVLVTGCLASPKTSGRAPDYTCGTHQGSRSRLLMCRSMSWVSCPLRGWPLGWVLLAVSMSHVLHHGKRSFVIGKRWEGAQSGRHHRWRVLGVPFFLPHCRAISSSLGISCFLFADFYDMQLSYSIREKERTCLQSCCTSPSLNRRGGWVQCCLPWIFPELFFSCWTGLPHRQHFVKSLSWDLKCVSKHWFGDSF